MQLSCEVNVLFLGGRELQNCTNVSFFLSQGVWSDVGWCVYELVLCLAVTLDTSGRKTAPSVWSRRS